MLHKIKRIFTDGAIYGVAQIAGKVLNFLLIPFFTFVMQKSDMGIYTDLYTWVAFLIATGMVLGAAYMLYLYRRIIFGDLTKDDLKAILDLNGREVAIFAPLVVLVLWMGIYPAPFLDMISASVTNLVDNYHGALAAVETGAALAAYQ